MVSLRYPGLCSSFSRLLYHIGQISSVHPGKCCVFMACFQSLNNKLHWLDCPIREYCLVGSYLLGAWDSLVFQCFNLAHTYPLEVLLISPQPTYDGLPWSCFCSSKDNCSCWLFFPSKSYLCPRNQLSSLSLQPKLADSVEKSMIF